MVLIGLYAVDLPASGGSSQVDGRSSDGPVGGLAMCAMVKVKSPDIAVSINWGGPFCGRPYHKGSTIWGPYKGPLIW